MTRCCAAVRLEKYNRTWMRAPYFPCKIRGRLRLSSFPKSGGQLPFLFLALSTVRLQSQHSSRFPSSDHLSARYHNIPHSLGPEPCKGHRAPLVKSAPLFSSAGKRDGDSGHLRFPPWAWRPNHPGLFRSAGHSSFDPIPNFPPLFPSITPTSVIKSPSVPH